MKVALVYNNKVETLAVVRALEKLLEARKIEIDTENPDVVITVGGDGTLISGFHKYQNLVDKILRLFYHFLHPHP